MTHHILSIFALFSLLSIAAPASAQFGFGGDGVIDVKAEVATYKGGVTILIGDVVVKQGDATIKSDKMTIYRAETANKRTAVQLGEITRIIADGNFSYDAPENKVTGDRGVYKRQSKLIDVFGNVKLTQPSGNVIESDTLFYDLENKRARFKNECDGGKCGRTNFEINNQ